MGVFGFLPSFFFLAAPLGSSEESGTSTVSLWMMLTFLKVALNSMPFAFLGVMGALTLSSIIFVYDLRAVIIVRGIASLWAYSRADHAKETLYMLEEMDFINVDAEPVSLWLPFDLSDYVEIYPGNMIMRSL